MPQLDTTPAPGCRAGGPRRGAILLLVAVVMIALSVLALAVLSLADANGLQQIRNQQAAGAFWIAEGGVHYTLANLKSRSTYRTSPTNLTGTVGGGVYTSVVVKTGTGYNIRSTGLNAGFRRTISLLDVRYGLSSVFYEYSLFSGDDITVKQNANIGGDVYAGGTADIKGDVTNGTIETGASYTNSTPPEVPALDTTPYYSLIDTATASGASSYPANLGGATHYVKENLTITNNITGPGVLVVSGNVGFDMGGMLGSGVMLVVGGILKMEKNFAAGSNCLFFARGGPLPVATTTYAISIDKDGLSLNGCAIITPASIYVDKTLIFAGIMYAGGDVYMKMDATVSGSIVAGNDIYANQNFTFYQDPGALPSTIPGLDDISMSNAFWEDEGTGGP